MKTIEQIFLESKDIFEVAVRDALDKVYGEYLPFVESDTCANAEYRAQDWLERFFADKLQEGDIKIDIARYGWCAENARQKIFEANRDAITEAIGKDWQAEIQSLKEQLNAAYRRY